MRRRLKRFLFLLILLPACASGIQPVPIEASDMCSFCKMAISEKQFAAEIITENEEVLKFDDIGCLLRYRQRVGDQPKAAAIFFVDYETQNWIKAENAFFVKSKTIKTPMGSGIVAFADKAKAGSESLRFDALSVSEK